MIQADSTLSPMLRPSLGAFDVVAVKEAHNSAHDLIYALPRSSGTTVLPILQSVLTRVGQAIAQAPLRARPRIALRYYEYLSDINSIMSYHESC